MSGPTMRDRLALALFVGAGNRSSTWEGFPRNSKAMYYRFADAALVELREPTEVMVEAGNRHTHCGGPCHNHAGRDTWQAMIDVAGATDT